MDRSRVCIVTGATAGIGRAVAEGLAARGAEVVLVSRDEARGRDAAARIREGTGNSRVCAVTADFWSQDSVRRAADELRRRYPSVSVLVNSAGAIFFERRFTPDGIEGTFAVSYLGSFLLTRLLLGSLRAGSPARVVNVVGEYHRKVELDFDDLQSEHSFSPIRAGSRATLAKVVFTLELARRLEGQGITVNCFHPGPVRTDLLRSAPWYLRVAAGLARPFMLSPARGADTGIFLATSAEIADVTGGYYVKRRRVEPSAHARDPEIGRRLWEASERLAGLPPSG